MPVWRHFSCLFLFLFLFWSVCRLSDRSSRPAACGWLGCNSLSALSCAGPCAVCSLFAHKRAYTVVPLCCSHPTHSLTSVSHPAMAAQMGKLAGSVALTFDAQLQEGQYKSVTHRDKTNGDALSRAGFSRLTVVRRSFVCVHSSLSVCVQTAGGERGHAGGDHGGRIRPAHAHSKTHVSEGTSHRRMSDCCLLPWR